MFDLDTDSLITASILMVVYEFAIIAMYIFTSDPFLTIFTSFANLSVQEVTDIEPLIRTVYFMVFAVAAIIPLIWFILWIFRTEPDWSVITRRF